MTLQPSGNSRTTTGLSWVGDTQEENTQRAIFQFQNFNLSLSTAQKFCEKWKKLGKNHWKHSESLLTPASCRAHPECGILALSLLCNWSTKSFPPVQWGWWKHARFILWVWTEVLSLPWKENTIQTKAMSVPWWSQILSKWSSSSKIILNSAFLTCQTEISSANIAQATPALCPAFTDESQNIKLWGTSEWTPLPRWWGEDHSAPLSSGVSPQSSAQVRDQSLQTLHSTLLGVFCLWEIPKCQPLFLLKVFNDIAS